MSDVQFKESDHSIFELLAWVKTRPAFLDGEKSLKRLRSFLVGYDCGLGRAHFVLRDRAIFDQFNDWVALHLGFSNSTSGWCKMISTKAGSDEKAYHLFFELLNRFCDEKGIGAASKK